MFIKRFFQFSLASSLLHFFLLLLPICFTYYMRDRSWIPFCPPRPLPTSLVSDSCRLDKGLIIPWICQALTSPMSSCDWCTDSGALPAKIPTLMWCCDCVRMNLYPWFLSDSKAPHIWSLGVLRRPSCGIPAWDVVVAWLGSTELWLTLQQAVRYERSGRRLSSTKSTTPKKRRKGNDLWLFLCSF